MQTFFNIFIFSSPSNSPQICSTHSDLVDQHCTNRILSPHSLSPTPTIILHEHRHLPFCDSCKLHQAAPPKWIPRSRASLNPKPWTRCLLLEKDMRRGAMRRGSVGFMDGTSLFPRMVRRKMFMGMPKSSTTIKAPM